MSRRKPTLRARIAAQREASSTWPHGFRSSWRTGEVESNHVLTVRCTTCHKPAFLMLARVHLITADEIETAGEILPAGEFVRDACGCHWVGEPTRAVLRPTVRRAVRAGLVPFGEHGAPTANLAPPPCPYCDAPEPQPCPYMP